MVFLIQSSKRLFGFCCAKLRGLLTLKRHLNLFHTLKVSIKFYYMNEVLYFKPVKIIAEIKLNGNKNKREMQDKKLFLNLRG